MFLQIKAEGWFFFSSRCLLIRVCHVTSNQQSFKAGPILWYTRITCRNWYVSIHLFSGWKWLVTRWFIILTFILLIQTYSNVTVCQFVCVIVFQSIMSDCTLTITLLLLVFSFKLYRMYSRPPFCTDMYCNTSSKTDCTPIAQCTQVRTVYNLDASAEMLKPHYRLKGIRAVPSFISHVRIVRWGLGVFPLTGINRF